jgi:hypothetical protein
VVQSKPQFVLVIINHQVSIMELIKLHVKVFNACVHCHKLSCKAENSFHISRWRLKHYKETFTGSALVDWLLGVGLAKDRNQASQYAHHLLDGRVIRHVENLHHFSDETLLYTFMSVEDRY